MWFRKEALKIINLSEEKQTEVALFKTDIRYNRKLGIWVHAFYSEYLVNELADDVYCKKRDSILNAAKNGDQPTLFLESYSSFHRLAERLERLGMKGTVYALVTDANKPTPLGLELLQRLPSLEISREQESQQWDKLANVLHQTPTPLRIGGECLVFFSHEDSKTARPRLGQSIKKGLAKITHPFAGTLYDGDGKILTLLPGFCVGITAAELALRGFDISFSLPAYPNRLWRESEFYV